MNIKTKKGITSKIMDFNPEAMHNAMSEGVRFKNQAFAAMEKGNYKKAVESFEKGLALMESGFGRDTPSTSPYLVGMSEAYIKLNEWDNAEKPAKRLLKKGRRNEDDSDIKTATELLSEIEIVIVDLTTTLLLEINQLESLIN